MQCGQKKKNPNWFMWHRVKVTKNITKNTNELDITQNANMSFCLFQISPYQHYQINTFITMTIYEKEENIRNY